jgi:hypothetical protein
MSDEQLSRSEFDALYREIQEHGTRLIQIMAFCVGGAAALLSYVFTINPQNLPFHDLLPPFLFFLPFMVLTPCLMLVQSSLHSTTRIAAYLIFRYEEKDCGVQWQRSVQAYRSNTGDGFRHRPFRWALVAVFGSMGTASLVASMISATSVGMHHCFNSPQKGHAFFWIYGALSVTLILLLALANLSLFHGWGRQPFEHELALWRKIGELPAVANSAKQPGTTGVV